jgi:hypothetical protein
MMGGISHRVVLAIQEAIDAYVGEEIDISELQARLAAGESALDSTYTELVEELRQVDADLEVIQFAVLHGEQRPAAVFRLERIPVGRPSPGKPPGVDPSSLLRSGRPGPSRGGQRERRQD